MDRIVENLFRIGSSDLAWDVFERCSRWVERFPYFPQTIGADELELAPHQSRWPLQISAGAGAQALIFGVFGIDLQSGLLRIAPTAAPRLSDARLEGYEYHGHSYDVVLLPATFLVFRDGVKVTECAYGTPLEFPPTNSQEVV